MFWGIILLFNALVLSVLAGYISVLGMAALFPAGGVMIVAMMATLEVAKLVVAGFLHAYWHENGLRWFHRAFMIIPMASLMVLTSIGIFGRLSQSHLEGEAPVAGIEIKIAQIEQRITQVQADRQHLDDRQKQLDAQISTVLGVSKSAKDAGTAQKLQVVQKKEREQLRKDITSKDAAINQLSDTLAPLKLQISDVSAKLGPLKYVANILGWKDPTSAVDMIIIMIMIAFDPLAIVMLLSAQFSFKVSFRKRREAKEKAALAKTVVVEPIAPVPSFPTIQEPVVQSPISPGSETMPVIVQEPIIPPPPIPEPIADEPHFHVETVETPVEVEDKAPVPPETIDIPVQEPVEETGKSSVTGPVALPAETSIVITQQPYLGSQAPLIATVALQPSAVTSDPTFLAGYTPQTDRDRLLDLLERRPDFLQQVVAIVEGEAIAPKPQSNAAPNAQWMSEPWFPNNT